MKLFFVRQQRNFHRYLEVLKEQPVMRYDRSRLKEKSPLFVLTASPGHPGRRVLFDYRLFPENILAALPQWKAEAREMRVGDTIVQQVQLPPLRWCSVKMIFGVRICEIIDEPGRIGFSYETLQGQVERGISTFTLEQENGEPVFRVHTFSEPAGRWLRKVAFLVEPYQRFCTKMAGRNVARQMRD